MKNFARQYTTFETSVGTCSIAWNDLGVSGFQLGTSTPYDIESWRKRRVPGAIPGQPTLGVSQIIDAATRYFSGEVVDFSDVVVDLRGQSELFAQIYTELRKVPYGKTTTYGELAKSIGLGLEKAREVGVAMATNPVPLIIPCHRVLAAGGRLGGFSAPGGTQSKVRMLELEGVTVIPERKARVDQTMQGSFSF